MHSFRYTATDAAGRLVTAEDAAPSEALLRAGLEARGLRVERIEEFHELQEFREPSLSSTEAATVAQQIADVSRLGLPLESGLRAMAEEAPTWRLKTVLSALATDIERGQSLAGALQARQGRIPEHLLQLVNGGLQTGTLALALERYVQAVRRSAEIRRKLWQSLVYPAVLLGGGTMLTLGFLLVVVPHMEDIFKDFNIELPWMTAAVLSVSQGLRQHWFWALPSLGVILAGTVFWYAILIRSVSGRRLLCAIPVVGPLLRLTALAEFAQLLGQFLETRTELPKALELAGSGSGDPVLEYYAHGLAQEVRQGVSLADAAAMLQGVPHSLRQIMRWSARPQKFAEALFAAAEMCTARAGLQAVVLGPLLEPLALFGTGAVFGLMIVSMFLPLIKLLNALS